MKLKINRDPSDWLGVSRIVSIEDIEANFSNYQKAISFYRKYPDKLLDLYVQASGESCSFRLYTYQRVMLRGMARFKDVFFTFSRGTSKSFVDDLWNILECILYPNSRVAIAASTKGQSEAILESKINEIFNMLPILKFEVKRIQKIKDQLTILFKNGSTLQNVAPKQSTRGLRFTGLALEEITESDPIIIQEVLLPTLAISRRAANGEYNKRETVSQQQIVITTAGYKDTYAYNKLIRTLLRQVSEPGKALVLGGSYRIPIIAGLQNMDFIRSQKLSGALNPASFEREFLSRWSSANDTSFFDAEIFDKYRAIQEPEFERQKSLNKGADYIFGLDVGRFSDSSELSVWRYVPTKGTTSTKYLVAIYTFENMHFNEQAVEIKDLYYKYLPQRVVIDGNGIGAGLIDILIQSQVDGKTGQFLAPWGVANDDKNYYSKYKSADMIPNVLYIVKANTQFNNEMYANFQTQLTTGKLRFLINERAAKLKMEESHSKKFTSMTEDEKRDWIAQYTQMTILREQMMNLEMSREGGTIVLKRINSSIKKDKVSSCGYALYYIKTEIDDKALQKNSLGLGTLFQNIAHGSSQKKGLNSLISRRVDYNSIRKRYK